MGCKTSQKTLCLYVFLNRLTWVCTGNCCCCCCCCCGWSPVAMATMPNPDWFIISVICSLVMSKFIAGFRAFSICCCSWNMDNYFASGFPEYSSSGSTYKLKYYSCHLLLPTTYAVRETPPLGPVYTCTVPKSRAAVDYTLTGWEPHRDPTKRVANSCICQY